MIQDSGRNIAGLVLVGLGGLFLLAQGTGFDLFSMGWPLFILIPGGIFLLLAFSDNEDTRSFIFPGVIVTGTGLILVYQNMTGHWESWAYIWTLYPVFIGISLRHLGGRNQEAEVVKVGRTMMIGGLLGFVVLGALFELFIFGSVGAGILTTLIPLAMVSVGIMMLVRGSVGTKQKRKSHDL